MGGKAASMGSQGGRVTKQDAIEAALRAILTNEHGLLEVEALRTGYAEGLQRR